MAEHDIKRNLKECLNKFRSANIKTRNQVLELSKSKEPNENIQFINDNCVFFKHVLVKNDDDKLPTETEIANQYERLLAVLASPKTLEPASLRDILPCQMQTSSVTGKHRCLRHASRTQDVRAGQQQLYFGRNCI